MNDIQKTLQGIEGVANISDDITLHATNQEEHDKRLRQVLERMKQHGLTANLEKCHFHMSDLTFKGHVLSDKGTGPTEQKVKPIRDARYPEKSTEVRSFLGLANFGTRHIPDFASTSEPLRRLTKKGASFEFGPELRKSFQTLKDRLAKAETLCYFDQTTPTRVIADASPVGLGAILIQQQKDGDKIISLTAVERRYSQTEKEALVLVWAYGMKFNLVTDHKPLETIYSPRSKPSARIERWQVRMQPYIFKAVYKPGCDNNC